MFNKIAFLTIAATATAIIFSLAYRLWLPWAYFILLFTFVLSTILLIFRYRHSNILAIYFAIALAYLILRGAYKFATGFTTIPLYDSYADFALLKTFMDGQQVSVLSDPTLGVVSGWPSLHLFGWIFSTITSLNVLQTALILPMLCFPVNLLYVYLLARGLVKELSTDVRLPILAVMVFTIISFSTYYDMEFTRYPFAYTFCLLGIYVLCKLSYSRMSGYERKLTLIFLLILPILAMTHIWASFTFALILLLVYVLTRLAKLVSFRGKLDSKPTLKLHLTHVLVAFITVFSWWMFYAASKGRLSTYFNFFSEFLKTLRLGFPEQVTRRVVHSGYSDLLRPYPHTYLLYVREALIYVPAGIALITILARIIIETRSRGKKRKNFNTYYLVLFTISSILVFAIYNVTILLPQRVLHFATLFTSIFAAIFYASMISKKRTLFKVFSACMIFFVGFTAFLSPWSISYIPVYIYDPSVRFEDVGVHNPLYPYLASFINERCNLSYTFLSDDPQLMYVLLPSEQYQLIRNIYDKSSLKLYGNQDTYITELIKLNLQARPLSEKLEITSTDEIVKIKQLIASKYNIVLDSSYYKIHVASNRQTID